MFEQTDILLKDVDTEKTYHDQTKRDKIKKLRHHKNKIRKEQE